MDEPATTEAQPLIVDPSSKDEPPLFNPIVRPDVQKIGMDELQDYAWRMKAGKVRVVPGHEKVPARYSCSCEPWCGGRYFPRVLHLRDLTWNDVEGLLRREYGDLDFEKWVKEMTEMKKLALLDKPGLARRQGSDPLYPTLLPVPFLVENALNHDFHDYFTSNPDKPERFRLLRKALGPLVIA